MNFVELARTLQPFMNPSGDTFIQVTSPNNEAGEQIELGDPLAHCIVKSLLSQYLLRGHPTERETRTALDVIVGEAFMRPRQEATLSVSRRVKQEPLAQAVIDISRQGETIKTPADLLGLLTRVAEKMGLETSDPKWPKSEDALGKQLTRLTPLLAAVGVAVTRHDTRPRTWSIAGATCDERDSNVTETRETPQTSCVEADTCCPADFVSEEVPEDLFQELVSEVIQ